MESPRLPVPPIGLTLSNLTLPKEGVYFAWVLVLAVLLWILFALTLVGIFYAVLIGMMLWLGNGLLVAHLKSSAVRVDESQLPELHRTYLEVCTLLGERNPPALYVLQAGGMLNAFATRHLGRNFVVVFSDMLEALGPSSPEMRFILGHELGHIRSNHIMKQVLLAPGMFFPLVGPAYRRAWESSCDRFGAFAAQDVRAASQALLVLGGGRYHGPALDGAAFARQHLEDRGFFVSLLELTSTYPTLTRRVHDVLALAGATEPRHGDRHPLAFIAAFLLPGGGTAAPVNLMALVVMMGLLAAMALPAFQKVMQQSQRQLCVNNRSQFVASLEQHRATHGALPATVGELLKEVPKCPNGGTYTIAFDNRRNVTVRCSAHDQK